MKELIALALESKASGKTSRYFLANHKDTVVELANTVEALRKAGKNEPIVTDFGKFYAEEYMLPQVFVDYINTQHVYFNDEAVGFGEFMPVSTESVILDGFDAASKDWKEKVKSTTNVLSPEQVTAFFRRFNENQDESDTIDQVKVEMRRLHLSDFKELVVKTDDGAHYTLVDWNSSGTLSGYLAILANIQSPVDVKYLATSKMPNVEEVTAWMFRK